MLLQLHPEVLCRGQSPTDLQSLLDSSHGIAVCRKCHESPFSYCCVIQSGLSEGATDLPTLPPTLTESICFHALPLWSRIVKFLSAASFPKSQIHQITHEETQYTAPQGSFCYVWPKTLSDQTSEWTSSSLWFISRSDLRAAEKISTDCSSSLTLIMKSTAAFRFFSEVAVPWPYPRCCEKIRMMFSSLRFLVIPFMTRGFTIAGPFIVLIDLKHV